MLHDAREAEQIKENDDYYTRIFVSADHTAVYTIDEGHMLQKWSVVSVHFIL